MAVLIKDRAIKAFIAQMIIEGADYWTIVTQLVKFCNGERGVGLHDNCITLIDGSEEDLSN